MITTCRQQNFVFQAETINQQRCNLSKRVPPSPRLAFPPPPALLFAMAIDHEKRRHDIAEIAIDLIAREGLEAATIRRIAGEAQFSTTAITYYFADKQQLLLWTFQQLSAKGDEQFGLASTRAPDDAIEALLTMVPWCPANVRRWKAYLAFWDQAARDPQLAALLAESTNAGIRYIQQLLRTKTPPGTDVEKAGNLLNAIIQGLAMQMLVDSGNWGPDKIREALQQAFDASLAMAR